MVGKLVNGITTGAFIPAGAGAWMWAAIALEVSPAKLRFTVIIVSPASKVTVPEPVAVLPDGGTS